MQEVNLFPNMVEALSIKERDRVRFEVETVGIPSKESRVRVESVSCNLGNCEKKCEGAEGCMGSSSQKTVQFGATSAVRGDTVISLCAYGHRQNPSDTTNSVKCKHCQYIARLKATLTPNSKFKSNYSTFSFHIC